MLPKPTVRVVLVLALPVMAQYGLNLIVSLSDSIIAGRLEATGPAQATLQAAQTNTHYLMWAITSYTVLVTVGSTALVARFIGAGDLPLARDTTHQSLLLAVGFAGLATGAGLLGGIDWLMLVLNLQPDRAGPSLAGDFLRVLFLFLVFQVVEQAGRRVPRRGRKRHADRAGRDGRRRAPSTCRFLPGDSASAWVRCPPSASSASPSAPP